jgi:hypothetical protein
MSIDTMEVDQATSEPTPDPAPDSLTNDAAEISALCSAYPQTGPVNMTTRPATLTWTDQGQITCHSAIQVAIAVSSILRAINHTGLIFVILQHSIRLLIIQYHHTLRKPPS